MRFEWDPKKAENNLKKHGISFELSTTVFDDPFALIADDERHSDREKREWILGKGDNDILIVIFTRRHHGRIFRLISARKANKKERKFYEENR